MKKRLEEFRGRFEQSVAREGKKPEEITVVFATKYLTPDQFLTFLTGDIPFPNYAIGENRVQAAGEKFSYVQQHRPGFPAMVPRVLIGNLQTNKINKAIDLFDELHAIDSPSLARAINSRLEKEKIGKRMPVYVEVNVSGEVNKHGMKPGEIDSMIGNLKKLPYLSLEGLMTMAPFSDNPEDSRQVFRLLRQLADRYALKTSMGMSNDWQVAIEEGSDEIRVGSVIFRQR